jgi:TldD protein
MCPRRYRDSLVRLQFRSRPTGPRLAVAAHARHGQWMTVTAYRAPFAPGGTHAIDADICRKLLAIALGQGGEYADLFFEYRAGGGLSFEEGITRSASRGVSMGLGVRVQRGDGTGYAHVEDLTWEAMKRAAETAARIASSTTKTHVVALEPVVLPRRYELDTPSIEVSGYEKRGLLERASKAAHAHDPRIVKVEASFAEEIREVLVATSDGRMAHDVQPLMRFGVRAIAEEGQRRESGRSGGGGRMTLGYFGQKTPEWHGAEAARQALVLLHAQGAPAGQMEVVLAPGDSGILLHEAVGHGLEADFNRKGTSNYTDQIGQEVASSLCTVVDDATLLQSRGSINVDDEGLEPERSVLIENGVLRGYMQDRLSARHFKTRPTGNGRRESFASVPMPRMTNTVLLGGPHEAQEIIASVKRGIFAQSFGGGQVDISNGDFVFSLTESYLIEDGRITTPLKGVNLIGNGPETLRQVSMLGNDVAVSDGIWTCGKDGQSVPVGVGCPTIKIARITVGGTEIG